MTAPDPERLVPVSGPKERLLAAALALAAGVFLLVFRALDQTGDSLAYAYAVRTGRELFHPHHLLFSPITHAIHVALAGAGITTDPLLAVQLHNVGWASVALYGFFRLGRECGWSRTTAALLTALLFACNGFLEFATQAEVYVPALACLVMLTLRLVQHSRQPLSDMAAVQIGLWWLLAIVYHQTNVLFALPLVTFAWLQRENVGLLRAVAIAGYAGAAVLALYVQAFNAQPGPHDLAGFVRYCLHYAVSHVPSWGVADNVSVLGVARQLKAQLTIVATLPQGRSMLLAGMALGFGVLLAGLVFAAARLARQDAGSRAWLVLALVWLLSYDAFFLWWLPGEKEFYVVTLIPLLLLLGGLLHAASRGAGRAAPHALLAGAVLALFVHGVRSTVLPLHASRGVTYTRAAEISAAGGRQHSIATGSPEGHALRYYFDIEGASELLMPLVQALATGAVPDTTLRHPGKALLLDLNDLRPDRLTQPNGFDHPKEWFAFMRWALESSRTDSSGAVTALAVQRTPDLQHSSIVFAPGTPARYADWGALFARLDSLDTQGPGSGRGVFSAWYAVHGERGSARP